MIIIITATKNFHRLFFFLSFILYWNAKKVLQNQGIFDCILYTLKTACREIWIQHEQISRLKPLLRPPRTPMDVCHKKNDLHNVVRVTIMAHSTDSTGSTQTKWREKRIHHPLAHCPMHNEYVNNVGKCESGYKYIIFFLGTFEYIICMMIEYRDILIRIYVWTIEKKTNAEERNPKRQVHFRVLTYRVWVYIVHCMLYTTIDCKCCSLMVIGYVVSPSRCSIRQRHWFRMHSHRHVQQYAKLVWWQWLHMTYRIIE